MYDGNLLIMRRWEQFSTNISYTLLLFGKDFVTHTLVSWQRQQEDFDLLIGHFSTPSDWFNVLCMHYGFFLRYCNPQRE